MTTRALFAFACVLGACGGAAAPKTVAIAPPEHVRTVDERKKDVCSRTELVALGGGIVSGVSHKPASDDIVKSVAARDVANTDVRELKKRCSRP